MTILRYAIAAAACVWLAGCVSTPPEEDPVVQKLTELDSRLLRIERVLANQSLLDLSQRIEAAQAETRTLRGQLDELQHQVAQAKDQQRELYGDVDRRLAALEGTGGGGAASNTHVADLPVPQGDDRDYHIVEGTKPGDELGDEVDRAEEPQQQADEGGPNAKRHTPVSDQPAHEPEHVGNDTEQVAEVRVARPDEPQDRDQDRPDDEQPRDDANDRSPVHAVILAAGALVG